MTITTFSSLNYANRLKEKGFTPEQAEILATLEEENHERTINHMITRNEVRQELILLEQRLVIKLGAMLVVSIGILFSLLKIFHVG